MEENEHYLRDVLESRGETNLGDYFLQYLRKKEESAPHSYDGSSSNFRRGLLQPPSPRKLLQAKLQRAGILRKADLPSIDFTKVRDAHTADETACYSFPL